VYFEGSPPAAAAEEEEEEEPLAVFPRGAPPNFICSHVPIEILLFHKTRKKRGTDFPSFGCVPNKLLT
jgi:hypothetical protein